MATRALFRDTRTGEEAWSDDLSDDPEDNIYFVIEGNFACDCNRSLFFDGDELPCNGSRPNVIELVRLERIDG